MRTTDDDTTRPPYSLRHLAEVADSGLHPWVRRVTPRAGRIAALETELEWATTTAVDDLEFGRGFASAQPQSGQGPEAYLNRWLRISDDLEVLAGPRYRARDPQRPFVSIEASSRVVLERDLPALRAAVYEPFAAFRPGYLALWSSEPAGSWSGTRSDSRNLAGQLATIRAGAVPEQLSTRPARDLEFYDRYAQIHSDHVRVDPAHANYTRVEDREDLRALLEAGTLFEVWHGDRWAGLVAGEVRPQRGLHGAVVVELLLAPSFRGRGLGRCLSTLLARGLELPDEQFLLGEINVDNVSAYRAALSAGRRDVGGEVLVALSHAGWSGCS